jgi:CRISPR-associated endonuclease Cas2
MPKKQNTLVKAILQALFEAGRSLPHPLKTTYGWIKRSKPLSYKEYCDTVYHLTRRGVVEMAKKNGQNFLRLTEKGALEILLQKADIQKKSNWDGKWRVLVFDIPEDAHPQRDRFRLLLKRQGFFKLQASVFVHPHPLNREAISYLEESGLIKYIRLLKVEEMDNDEDLRARFGV